jgi:hypothetical protein
VEMPRAVARGVGAAAGVVVGEARGDVVRKADVVARLGIGAVQNVDESLVFGHSKAKARSMPKRWNAERPETTNTRHTDGSFCDPTGVIACGIRDVVLIERSHPRTEGIGEG